MALAPVSVGELPSGAPSEVGEDRQGQHRQQPSVHRAVICLFRLLREREKEVGPVRRGSIPVRPLIHVYHIRHPKDRGTFGSTHEQGEADSNAEQNGHNNQHATSEPTRLKD